MTNIKIALEWFLNPDHLPMIAAIEDGSYEKAGLVVELIQPEEHYDGFEDLKSGKIDIHCNEPLHLYEHYFDGIKSLGCFFETRGGVMIRQSSVEKLQKGEPLKITTPAANEVTNKIGYEIIKRYCKKLGYPTSVEQVTFVETDFWHLNNMKNDSSFDGAWLCFYNFEGIEAKMEGFENLFIDQNVSPYPNFSALEFMTTKEIMDGKKEAFVRFLDVTSASAQKLKNDDEFAREVYYKYTKEDATPLMDNIIQDTLTRLESTIAPSSTRWQELRKFLEELDVVTLSQEQYNSIWS